MADDAAPPTVARRRREEAPQLHRGLRRASSSTLARDGPADRRRSPRACPPGTGLNAVPGRVPGPVHRRRHRRAARDDDRDRASRWAASGRSSRSTRRSSSGPSTRPSTTSARTTSRSLIAVDRAGLVGEDGTSHQGMFTLPAQRQLPNLVIATPKDEQELRSLVRTALAQDHPFALHYPRDPGFDLAADRAGACSRSARARSSARARTCCSSASGRSWRGRSRRPTRSRPRAGRSASSTPGSPSRSTGS